MQYGRGRIMQPFVALFASSFIAGAATAPIAAFHFNQLSQYGLIANLGSVPVMGMLVMPAAVLAGLLSPFGLDAWAFWIMGQGVHWILGVAHFVAGLNGSTIAVPQGGAFVLPLIGFGSVLFILWRGAFRWAGPVLFLLAIGIWINTPRPEVLISDTGRLLGVMKEQGRALNRKRGSGFAALVWLENDGDKAEQIGAADRDAGFSDAMVMDIGVAKIGYVWPKKTPLSELESYCRKTDILISPNWKEDLPGGCIQISQSYLRRNGSVAIMITKGQVRVKTARQMAGARIWNSWWLRRKP
jgi:competence protein ComEC